MTPPVKQEIICVIPSRAGSQRILEKNLQEVAGHTLIEHACIAVPKYVTHTIVTTDCHTSARIAHDHHFEVVWRPEKLSTGFAGSGMAVWHHALAVAEGVEHMDFDCSILLQPSTPTRTHEDISRCVDMVLREGFDSACTVSPVPDRWAPHKQVDVRGGQVHLIERRRSASFSRNGACFAANVVGLLGDFYANCAAVTSVSPQINIDEPFDVELARLLMQ
jgi:CMP-N-acetylneuraminic acid synthetase